MATEKGIEKSGRTNCKKKKLLKTKTNIMYNILQARIEYKTNQISSVTVLVEISKGDVRAIAATSTPKNGYTFIPPGATISNELLQDVAGSGCEIDGRDKIFPNWKSKI
jgi:hypothetical protein